MNHKVRNSFAAAAVGALACSLAFAPVATAAQSALTEDTGAFVNNSEGWYNGRISGASRFGTAVAASRALYTAQGEAGPSDYVILANQTSWSDTLAATPLADALDAPILYTYQGIRQPNGTTGLQADTLKELQRLEANGASTVIIIGGELAVSAQVANAIEDLGFDVDRIGGQSRYDTALHLAAEAVENYEGTTRLADARAAIAAVEQAEAEYRDALAAWETANAATGTALTALQEAIADLAAANAALKVLTDQIVEIPPADAAAIEALNEALIAAQAVANDHGVLINFVNGLLIEYSASEGADFQADPWADVEAFFGDTQLTVTLSTGPYTGTLAELSATVPYLSAAVTADATPAKDVEEQLREAQVGADEDVVDAQTAYAAAVAALVAQIDAIAANEALQRQIAAAYAVVATAQDAAEAAFVAFEAAGDAEEEARLEFLDAAEARPTVAEMRIVRLAHEAVLDDVLADSTEYPAFLATGLDFPDALAAGPAAAAEAGVVLLTRGASMHDSTERYLDNGAVQIAVGGPAAAAAPDAAESYIGASRYETATQLAAAYFEDYAFVGLANGQQAADAVVAGAAMANVDGTLVLARPNLLPPTTANFLSYEAHNPDLVIFGGPLAISNDVRDAAIDALES